MCGGGGGGGREFVVFVSRFGLAVKRKALVSERCRFDSPLGLGLGGGGRGWGEGGRRLAGEQLS